MYAAPPLGSVPEDPGTKPNLGFGSHFRQLRRARGLTQEQLAERSGVAPDTIRRLEHDAFSPSYRTLEKMAQGLRLPLSCVIEGYELRERDLGSELASLVYALDEELREPFFTLISRLHDCVSGAAVLNPGDDGAAQIGTSPTTIGQHVKSLRSARGLTQDELAARAGFSADTLRRLERGRATSFNVVRSAASAMGLSLSAFFTSYELPERALAVSLEWVGELEGDMQVCALRAIEQLRLMLTTEPCSSSRSSASLRTLSKGMWLR